MSWFDRLTDAGVKRNISAKMARVITVGCTLFALYLLYSIVYAYPTVIVFRGVFLMVMVALAFVYYTTPGGKKDHKSGPFDLACALLALAIGVYIVLNGERLAFRLVFLDPLTTWDKVLGLCMIALVLEATRRVVGYSLVLIAIAFLLYPFYGAWIPGLFGHRGFSVAKVIELTTMTTNGIFGMPIGTASTYIFMFSLFGEVLSASGAGDVFFALSRSVVGAKRGGMAQTAVIASALFGSISGSPIANVATTGSFTIPMMKRMGYPAHFAAAVETAASCGGTIMPPVMGAVAFVMAEVIGVNYATVILVAFIPALLYFGSVFLGVDSASVKLGLKGIPRSELPRLGPTLLQSLRFLGPLVWLVYRILSGFTVHRAVFESTLLLLAASYLTRDRRQWMTLTKTLAALAGSVKTIMTIAIACAASGIIVGIISLTGVGVKFTSLVMALAAGRLFLALFLTMVVTLILGLGMNITPTYILAASLAAPALIKVGADTMAIHMFILYYAAMATMTPPVAIAAFTAASIAEADPMRTGFDAMRLGIVAYIIPFVFVYRPEILLSGPVGQILLSSLAIFVGCYALANGINQWFLRLTTPAERAGLFLAALALFWPNYAINLVGLGLLVLIGFKQYRENARLR